MNATELEQRVLVWAPTGSDAPLVAGLLREAGIPAAVVASVADFSRELSLGAGAAFIAREALDGPAMDGLSERLKEEPAWSKLPIVLVTWRGAERGAKLFSLADHFVSVANVVFLERPFTTDVLLGSVRFAVRTRLGQYELRDAAMRLDASAEELRRSNRDLEHFASVAAHDLQEPLRTMASFADLLDRRYADRLDARGREFCAHISDGARRMSMLIASIKEYSLAGRAGLGLQTIALARPLGEATANLRRVIVDRGARVEHGALPEVTADPVQLVVLFQNLISNAVKYAARQPLVRIDAAVDGPDWRISIADNGPGIAEGDRQRIFELFTRLEAIGISGSGIGLATCKRVVERHGGRIGVDSTPGRGSTFWFTLPRSR